MKSELTGAVETGVEGAVETDVEGVVETGVEGAVETDVEGVVETGVEGAVETDVEGAVETDVEGVFSLDVGSSSLSESEPSSPTSARRSRGCTPHFLNPETILAGVKAFSQAPANKKSCTC